MKHLVLLVAASVLGTGCFVSNTCDSRNVTVTWGGFAGPESGQSGISCSSAGVTAVDLYLDGRYVASWPCTDGGAIIAGVRNGSQLLTAEGVDGSGVVRYRDEVEVNVSGCGDFGVTVRPAAGILNLNYAFQSGSTCASATSFMWFSIYDEITGQTGAAVDSASTYATKRSFPCGPDALMSLPAGEYRLDFMQEVIENPATVFTEAARACATPRFVVTGRTTTDLPVTLYDTGTGCP